MLGVLLSCTLSGLDGSGGAWATDTIAANPDTAARLAAELNAAPCQPFSTFSVPLRCQWQGQISVSMVGDHYQAEVPEVVAFIGNGRQIALGTLRLDFRPGLNGALDFALTLPSTLALAARDGAVETNVSLGSQTIRGRWEPSARSVTQLDAIAGDVRLTSPADPYSIAIGSLALTEALAETQPGRWDGQAALTLGSFAVQAADGGELLHLGSATFDGQVTGLDIALAIARRAQSQAAVEPVAPNALPAKEAGETSKKELVPVARHYLARIHDLFDGASGGIHLTDLRVKVPMVDTSITLGKFDYRTAVNGLEHGKSTLTVTYDHGPLLVTPAPALQDFLPKGARLALTASGLPNDDLWQALDRVLQPNGPGGGDRVIKALIAEADAVLTKAGVHLALETLSIDTHATTLNLTGQARYEAAATMGMVGHFDMIIRGFDAALKALQPAPGTITLSDESKNILSALTMLQVMGLPAKDDAGRDVRTYTVDVAETGGVMLNGADITILVQSLRDRLGLHSKPTVGAAGQGG